MYVCAGIYIINWLVILLLDPSAPIFCVKINNLIFELKKNQDKNCPVIYIIHFNSTTQNLIAFLTLKPKYGAGFVSSWFMFLKKNSLE